MRWLEKLPLMPLVMVATMLALAPFTPEPHLWEKLKMVAAGSLSQPIDIFDLLLHGGPLCLLALKLISRRKQQGPTEN